MKDIFLFIDADDTLWDDGRYFSEALTAFQRTMAQLGCPEFEVNPVFQRQNEKRRLVVGYGAYAFAAAMLDTQEILVPHCAPETFDLLKSVGDNLVHHPVECYEGVSETLLELSDCIRLVLVTQGDRRYQQRKIDDSGLGAYFHAIEIVPEKTPSAYSHIAVKYRVCPERTWMVGNSPACDINPALEAGLGAIYIPNPFTWTEDIVPLKEESIELLKFSDLLNFIKDRV